MAQDQIDTVALEVAMRLFVRGDQNRGDAFAAIRQGYLFAHALNAVATESLPEWERDAYNEALAARKGEQS